MEVKDLKLGTYTRVYPRMISDKVFQMRPLMPEISNLEYIHQDQKDMADIWPLRMGMVKKIFYRSKARTVARKLTSRATRFQILWTKIWDHKVSAFYNLSRFFYDIVQLCLPEWLVRKLQRISKQSRLWHHYKFFIL